MGCEGKGKDVRWFHDSVYYWENWINHDRKDWGTIIGSILACQFLRTCPRHFQPYPESLLRGSGCGGSVDEPE